MNACLVPEVLSPVTSEVAEFNQTAAGLAQLREDIAGRTFDCTTTAGDKEARQVRMSLVSLRTTIDAKRKELKAPLLERGRLIDSEAARIVGEIKALEDPIDAVIRQAEAEREARRQERERAEAERLAAINSQIDRIRNMPSLYVTATLTVITEAVRELQGMDLDALFDDVHRPRAADARAAALETLATLHSERSAAIAESARLAAERAELERQQAEAIEARRVAEAEALAARAEADRLAKAERDRLAAEQAAELEAIAAAERAERAKREAELAEREAASRAEQARIAAEQAAERERMEADAIANADLRMASEAAFIFLDAHHPAELVTRMLGAALEREV